MMKRKQVKNACVNCQKACKKCDEGRPCARCIKYGLETTCVDSQRKERSSTVKRGPYRKVQLSFGGVDGGGNGGGRHLFQTDRRSSIIPLSPIKALAMVCSEVLAEESRGDDEPESSDLVLYESAFFKSHLDIRAASPVPRDTSLTPPLTPDEKAIRQPSSASSPLVILRHGNDSSLLVRSIF